MEPFELSRRHLSGGGVEARLLALAWVSVPVAEGLRMSSSLSILSKTRINPLSDLCILQPVPYDLRDISFVVLAPRNLGSVGKVAQTSLVSGRITCMNPEDPGFGRLLSDSMAVFDGKPCFPIIQLALNGPPLDSVL